MLRDGQTERLLLRPLEIADAPQIQQLFPRWEIVRYLLTRVPWPYPPDGALQFCTNVANPQMKRGDAWHWTIGLAAEPERLIGMISLIRSDRDNRGFWLGLPWQGRGLMTEACVWANNFWFETLGFRILRASKASANLASRRISEKLGMRLVGTEEREYIGGRMTAELWEMTAEEWKAWKRRSGERRA